MVTDHQQLVDRWLRYLAVRSCPECQHDAYQIRWTTDYSNGQIRGKYWRYRCVAPRCSTVWWDPQKGPAEVTVPKLLNKQESS